MERISFALDSYTRSIGSSLPPHTKQHLANCFAHQNAVYELGAKPSFETRLAHYFYSEPYYVPLLMPDRNVPEPREYAVEEVDKLVTEFLDTICYSSGASDRARTYFLLGDRGVGKTSFISYCITRRLRHYVETTEDPFRPIPIWFVRLEIERLISRDMFQDPASPTLRRIVLEHLSEQIIHVLDKNPAFTTSEVVRDRLSKLRETRQDAIKSETELGLRIQDLTSRIAEEPQERRLLLIVDNLDYVTHYHDDRLFAPGSVDYKNVLSALQSVRSLFTHDNGPLGRMGVNVLFSVRPGTFDAIRAMSADAAHSWPEQNSFDVFTLQAPPVGKVVEARSKLLKWAVENNLFGPKDRPLFAKASLLKEVLDAEVAETSREAMHRSTFLDAVDDLACESRRDLMAFLQMYSAISDNHPEDHWRDSEPTQVPDVVLNRLIAQENTGLIAYMLKDKTRFSEMHCAFPCIYLVESSGGGEVAEPFMSYWLRRLLIEHLAANGPQSVRGLIDLFCGEGGYPEKLVTDSLRQLAQTRRNQVIKCDWRWEEKDYKPSALSITSRGRRLVVPTTDSRRPLADRFAYLQLVSDEPRLWLPKHLIKYFRHNGWSSDGKQRLDYNYIGHPQRTEFRRGMAIVFNHKFRAVMLLVDVLEAAWTAEAMRSPALFRELGYTSQTEESASRAQGVKLINLGARLKTEAYLGMKRVHDRVRDFVEPIEDADALATELRADTYSAVQEAIRR